MKRLKDESDYKQNFITLVDKWITQMQREKEFIFSKKQN